MPGATLFQPTARHGCITQLGDVVGHLIGSVHDRDHELNPYHAANSFQHTGFTLYKIPLLLAFVADGVFLSVLQD
jgi:hypothetical protein